MEQYDKYKDSGIEWIGEIPEHWEVKRIRHLAKIYGRIGYRGYKVTDLVHKGEGAITISPSNMKEFDMDFYSCTYLSWNKYEESPEIMIYNGDILFVKTGSTYGKSSFVKDLPEKATINPQIVVLKNIASNNKLLWYIIKSNVVQFQVEQTVVGGTIPTISQARINNYFFPISNDFKEQAAIANYLDRKTAEIDELIADKRRLLELYEEEKTAIINQAVTKGINPDVPLKDSGIEWLGEIPEHWEILPIKYTLSIPITDGPHETPELLPDGVPFISAEAIKNDKIDFNKKRGYISQEEHERFSLKYKPQIGDVYMIKSGATTGNLGIVETDIEFNIWSPLAAMRPNYDILLSKFLFYFMKSKSFFSAIELGWNYGTQQNIGMKVLENIRMVLPIIEEQIAIVQYIEKETTRIIAKSEKTKKLIDLLTEYRTALISEVVTGKIKVTE